MRSMNNPSQPGPLGGADNVSAYTRSLAALADEKQPVTSLFANRRPELPDLEQIARRFIEDVITEQLAHQWWRRAEVFEGFRVRPGDYLGQWAEARRDSPEVVRHLLAEDIRRASDAAGLRCHAVIIAGGWPDPDDIELYLNPPTVDAVLAARSEVAA